MKILRSSLILLGCMMFVQAEAQVPELINYQGRLVDGTNLVSGTTLMVFKIFNTSTGGSPLYQETQTVTVVDGLYATEIGASNTVPGTLSSVLTNSQVFLEIMVGTATLTPRQRVVSVAYALHAWGLSGNAETTPGTHFLGTTDSQPLELRVNNQRVARLEAASAPNIILGDAVNAVSNGTVGATISGGSSNTVGIATDYASIGGGSGNGVAGVASVIGGGALNSVTGVTCVIAGGVNNSIQNAARSTIGGGNQHTIRESADNTTIAGGTQNTIRESADNATIGGGGGNIVGANADYGTIPGGLQNEAGGDYSFAAGRQAKATNDGAFVWADSAGVDFASSADNQFLIRASGGVGINTNQTPQALTVNGNVQADSFIAGTNSTTYGDNLVTQATDGEPFGINVAGGNAAGEDFAVVADNFRLTTNGDVAANSFSGDGTGLTSVTPGDDTVTSQQITDGSISNADMAAASVTGDKIADGTITADDVDAATFSNTFWKTDGNAGTTAGTRFLGTTDNQPLNLAVNGSRALRLEPTAVPNIIGGAENNSVQAGRIGGTIAGGAYNRTFQDYATVGGGSNNTVQGFGALIAGGQGNNIGGNSQHSSILGGQQNNMAAWVEWSTIGGGQLNTMQNFADHSVIGGGVQNDIDADHSTIGGGKRNDIEGFSQYVTIGGGQQNFVGDAVKSSTIAGGEHNSIETNSNYSTIGGGRNNKISRDVTDATIGGGRENDIGTNALYATVPGGRNCDVGDNASYAFAAGRRAKANHPGAFVWADSLPLDFASTADRQFLIRASGGVGINTNATPEALTVNGNVQADSFMAGTNSTTYGDRFISQSSDGEPFLINVAGGNVEGEDFAVVADNFRLTTNGDVTANSFSGDGAGITVQNEGGGDPIMQFSIGLGSEKSWTMGIDSSTTNFIIASSVTLDFLPYFVITKSGNVGLGRTPTANDLEVEGTASKDSAGDWLANSDVRIKTKIEELADPLDVINRLRPVRFHYTEAYKAEHPSIENRPYYNFVAQEFVEVFPDHVKDDGTGLLQVDAYPVRPYLAAAVQELARENRQLKERLANMEVRMSALEDQKVVRN